MPYIEAHQELRDHPKIKRASRVLGVTRAQMVGHLICLWWWCLDYAEDGNLSDFSSTDIAEAAEWDDDPDAFVSALLTCGPAGRAGFLVDRGNGIEINDWASYGGKYITKRNQGRARQREYRLRNAGITIGDADVTQSDALVTRHSTVSNATRGEEIREDDRRVDERVTQSNATSREVTPDNSPTYPPGFEEFEKVFKMNLITEVTERDPRQSMMGGFSFDETSRALLLQVFNKGPMLSSKAVTWGMDQWESAKKDQQFRVQDRGCINWLLTTIFNSYKPTGKSSAKNGSDPVAPREKEEWTVDYGDGITGKVLL